MTRVTRLTRLVAAVAAAALIPLLLLVPAAAAADPAGQTGRVLISIQGDVTLPAGDQADAVIVTGGTATIAGQVHTVFAVDGTVVIQGATVTTIVAVRSPVTLENGTVVSGDVVAIDSAVQKIGDATVQGAIRGPGSDLIAFAAILIPIVFLFYLGLALASVVAGLFLAGLAARQVRSAEAVISHEPLTAIGVGLLGLIITPAVAILAMVTVIGAPLGLAIFFGVWPLIAFIGYLVAGILDRRVGILHRSSPSVERERPYLAAVIGLLSLFVLGVVPFVTPIASLFGFGAVLVVAWRTLTHHESGATQAPPQPVQVPSAS